MINQSASSGSGKKIKVDSDVMDDLAKNFHKDADTFVGKVRSAHQVMGAGNAGLKGWTSAKDFPGMGDAIAKHGEKMEQAKAFLEAVAQDLGTMGSNTKALKSSLLGEDDGNGELIKTILPNFVSGRGSLVSAPKTEGQ